MSISGRLFSLILAFTVLAAGIFILVFPHAGYIIIIAVISVYLIVSGILSFVYYFTLAKHMAGGATELLRGLIYADIGIYLMFRLYLPSNIVMIYLLVIMGVYGAINLIRAIEFRKSGVRSWKIKMAAAVFLFCLLIVGNIFSGYETAVSWIYALFLFEYAAERIYSSFRKTALEYIA